MSLNPCLDDILVEVAAPEQILALSHFSRDPSASSVGVETAKRFGVTGGTAEEVLALEPDIVLASTFMPPATRAAFERLGLRVESFGSPSTAEESAKQVERIGELSGKQINAKALARAMLFPTWPPLYTPPPPPAKGWEPAPDPSVLLWQPGQIVAGDASLIIHLIKQEGFTSYGSEAGMQQADHVSLERILIDPPDVLLVAGDSAGQSHPILDKLEGTRVHPFAPNLFYCGGPSILKAREELNRIRLSFEDFGG